MIFFPAGGCYEIAHTLLGEIRKYRKTGEFLRMSKKSVTDIGFRVHVDSGHRLGFEKRNWGRSGTRSLVPFGADQGYWVLGYWAAGVLGCWGAGVLGRWVLEYWGVEVECWLITKTD
jgi:hypothetical protein